MLRRFISQFALIESYFALLLAIISLYSCNPSTIPIKYSFNVEYNTEPLKLSKYFNSCKVIVLDTILEARINNIDRLLFTDDRIIVVDKMGNKCVSFDMEGNYIGSTTKYIGRSKDEYIHMIDAAIDTCTHYIYMYNDFPGNMLILDQDMNFVRNIKIDSSINEFTVSGDEIYTVGNDANDSGYTFANIINKNSITTTPVKMQKAEKKVYGVKGIGKSLVNSNGCYVSLPFDNRIFKLNKEETECIEINFGDKWLADNFEGTVRPSEFINKYSDYHWTIQNFQAVDSVFFFNTNKGGLFIGNTQNQKVEMYPEVLNDIIPITNSWLIPSQGLQNSLILEVYPQSVISYIKHLEKGNMNIPTEYKCLKRITKDHSVIAICKRGN